MGTEHLLVASNLSDTVPLHASHLSTAGSKARRVLVPEETHPHPRRLSASDRSSKVSDMTDVEDVGFFTIVAAGLNDGCASGRGNRSSRPWLTDLGRAQTRTGVQNACCSQATGLHLRFALTHEDGRIGEYCSSRWRETVVHRVGVNQLYVAQRKYFVGYLVWLDTYGAVVYWFRQQCTLNGGAGRDRLRHFLAIRWGIEVSSSTSVTTRYIKAAGYAEDGG